MNPISPHSSTETDSVADLQSLTLHISDSSIGPISPRDPLAERISHVWEEYFSTFDRSPFVHYSWKKYQKASSPESERVNWVYMDLKKELTPIFSHLTETTLSQIHRWGSSYNQATRNFWPSVYYPRKNLSELIEALVANMDGTGNYTAPSSAALKYLGDLITKTPNSKLTRFAQEANFIFAQQEVDLDQAGLRRAKLGTLFYALLELSLDERLQDLDQTLQRLPQIDHLESAIQKSYRLKIHLEDLRCLLTYVDLLVQRKFETHNLEIIRKKLTQEGLSDIDGTPQEWVQYLKTHPEEAHKATRFDLKSLNINYLPPSFSSLDWVNVTEIDLSDNQLRFLPEPDEFFADCRALRSIDLSDNYLKELHPNLLENCTKLVRFRCNHNLISRLGNIGTKWNLSIFSCAENQIKSIADSFGCSWGNCLEVSLQHNGFAGPEHPITQLLRENLPLTTAVRIGNTANVYDAWIKFFDLYQSKPGTEFVIQEWNSEKNRSKNPTATVLQVYRELLKKAEEPESKKIEETLIATEEQIYESCSYPDSSEHSFLRQHFAQLEKLFHSIENSISQKEELKNLKRIRKTLEETGIYFEGSTKDWIAYLERNPEERKKIFRLKLSGIGLTYLPPRFSLLPLENLTHIDLSNNDLTFLPNPPFPNCHKITHVNLSQNDLRTLPQNLLNHCKLKELKIDSNWIKDLTPLLIVRRTHLEILCASDNSLHIEDIPLTLAEFLPQIQRIDFNHNNILINDVKTRELIDKFKSTFPPEVIVQFEQPQKPLDLT